MPSAFELLLLNAHPVGIISIANKGHNFFMLSIMVSIVFTNIASYQQF